MKQRLQGLVIGIIIGTLLAGSIALAATKNLEAAFNNIKIVVDGSEISPKDANGNAVEPFIVDGTTYLPVRAVANALDKAVYWDGPNWTVYLGNMDGKLEYPTMRIDQVTDIGRGELGGTGISKSNKTEDNYGNSYNNVISLPRSMYNAHFRTLLNMQYSRFKGTLYVPKGETGNLGKMIVELDGGIIYTSPEMTATSKAVDINIEITGGNDFIIRTDSNGGLQLAGAGFYQ